MANTMRIQWKMDGFKALRTSVEMKALLLERANKILANAESVRPGYYEVKPGGDSDRARVFVTTVANENAGKAIRHEQKSGTLVRAASVAG